MSTNEETPKARYLLEGSAFGVDIWRDPATGHLYASRGGSPMQSLDPAVDLAEPAAAEEEEINAAFSDVLAEERPGGLDDDE